MKRTDLIALIDRLSPQSIGHIYEGLCPDSIKGWDSRDPKCEACRQLEAAREAVDFLRQIAQAQPVAWRVRSRGQFKRFEPGPWRIYWSAAKPNVNAPQDCDFDPLYRLPLED